MVHGRCNIIPNLPSMDDFGGWLTKLYGILISALAGGIGAVYIYRPLQWLLSIRRNDNRNAD
jgi:hypothetical protein